MFDNFAFDEVINQTNLELKTRFIAFLSILLGSHSIDEFKAMVTATYNFGVTTVEMKEIVYQGTTYLGIGRVFPFLHALNQFCQDHHIALPLEGQSITITENCFGDYYTRTGLDSKQREMITFCFLYAQGGFEP